MKLPAALKGPLTPEDRSIAWRAFLGTAKVLVALWVLLLLVMALVMFLEPRHFLVDVLVLRMERTEAGASLRLSSLAAGLVLALVPALAVLRRRLSA